MPIARRPATRLRRRQRVKVDFGCPRQAVFRRRTPKAKRLRFIDKTSAGGLLLCPAGAFLSFLLPLPGGKGRGVRYLTPPTWRRVSAGGLRVAGGPGVRLTLMRIRYQDRPRNHAARCTTCLCAAFATT
jgi:hypothetical protein